MATDPIPGGGGVTLDEVQGLIDSAMRRIVPSDPVVQCTAEMPHDELVYLRGPNIYNCRCGKHYRKNGPVLMEVD